MIVWSHAARDLVTKWNPHLPSSAHEERGGEGYHPGVLISGSLGNMRGEDGGVNIQRGYTPFLGSLLFLCAFSDFSMFLFVHSVTWQCVVCVQFLCWCCDLDPWPDFGWSVDSYHLLCLASFPHLSVFSLYLSVESCVVCLPSPPSKKDETLSKEAKLLNSEHSPINLPNSNMSIPQEYAATITCWEDLNLPRPPGASSSSQLNSHFDETRRIRDKPHEDDGEPWFCCRQYKQQGDLCGHGSWNSCFKFILFCVKGKRDRDLNVVQTSRDRQKPWTGTWIVREWRKIGSAKANQWADQAQRDKISLKRELEMRNRLFSEHQAKVCQEIEELKRYMLRRNRSSETSNNWWFFLCIKRGFLRLWVNCWLKFRIYWTK